MKLGAGSERFAYADLPYETDNARKLFEFINPQLLLHTI
jgi:hypothetical protein